MKPVERFRRALEQIVEMAERSDSHPDMELGLIARRALFGVPIETSPSCVFCSIVADHSLATGLVDYDDVVVFDPLNPVTPGHKLVVPKTHVANAAEDPKVTAYTMEIAAIHGSHTMDSFNIITSKGEVATQSVFHLHVHLVPRRFGDGLRLPWTKLEDGSEPPFLTPRPGELSSSNDAGLDNVACKITGEAHIFNRHGTCSECGYRPPSNPGPESTDCEHGYKDVERFGCACNGCAHTFTCLQRPGAWRADDRCGECSNCAFFFGTKTPVLDDVEREPVTSREKFDKEHPETPEEREARWANDLSAFRPEAVAAVRGALESFSSINHGWEPGSKHNLLMTILGSLGYALGPDMHSAPSAEAELTISIYDERIPRQGCGKAREHDDHLWWSNGYTLLCADLGSAVSQPSEHIHTAECYGDYNAPTHRTCGYGVEDADD